MVVCNYTITYTTSAVKLKIIAIAIKTSKPPVTEINKSKLYSDTKIFKEIQFVETQKSK